MINYGKVRSSEIPQETQITTDYVYVASNIEPYELLNEDKILTGYEYDYIAYTKDEYIQLILEENSKTITELEDELSAVKILLGVE